MKIVQCNICYEAWPLSTSTKSLKNSEYYVCARCKRDKKALSKFSKEGKMIPNKVADALKNLTQVEEMLYLGLFWSCNSYKTSESLQRPCYYSAG